MMLRQVKLLGKVMAPPGSKMIGRMTLGLTTPGVDGGRPHGTMDMASILPGTTMGKTEMSHHAGRNLWTVG